MGQTCSYMQQLQQQLQLQQAHHIPCSEMSAKAVNSGLQVQGYQAQLTLSSCSSGMLDSRSPARDAKLHNDSTTSGIIVQEHDMASVRGMRAIR